MGLSAMAAPSLVMQGIGAVGGAIGSYQSAKLQKSQLQYAASMADVNAKLADTAAQQELIKGQQDASRLKTAGSRLKGEQRAAYAAGGVDVNSGSALVTQNTTDFLSQQDADTAMSNALMAAWGYKTQGANQRAEARVQRASASGISPGMAGFTSLLGGASQVASDWYKFKKAGALDNPPPAQSYPPGNNTRMW